MALWIALIALVLSIGNWLSLWHLIKAVEGIAKIMKEDS